MKKSLTPPQRAAHTAKWAVTMTKVRIRQAIARTKWQLVTFVGPKGGESVGIVDMMAVRKDHRPRKAGYQRGDRLQIVLIQVKGGAARDPKLDEIARLRSVAKHHGAYKVLLACWKKGRAAEFRELRPAHPAYKSADDHWSVVRDLDSLFD
jgi:hypothetical protein